MAEIFPDTVESALKQTLAQYRHWRTPPETSPSVERRLLGGFSNFSALVTAGTRRFVVRIDGIDLRDHPVSRDAEWRTLLNAAAAGLAPQPQYRNGELGALVCEYLEADAPASENPEALMALLRGIHGLPPIHYRLRLARRLEHYRHLALERGRQASEELVKRLGALNEPVLETLARAEQHSVLCHNDLTPANRLCHRGRLYAIDWEYAAMGPALFDVAVATAAKDPEIDVEPALAAYLQRPPARREIADLRHFIAVYHHLAALWFAVCNNAEAEAAQHAVDNALRAQAMIP
jgi:thiamine kinase